MPALATKDLDLKGFLLAHAGMRQEFRLLAAVAREPLDAARARLAEEQIALVVTFLHRHHTVEDERIWPLLRERVPACAPELDALEADHGRLDPLLLAVADVTRPLRERADHLQELHGLLNAHLDREDAAVLPLLRAHVSAKEWEDLEAHARQETSDLSLPRLVGWLAGAADAELREAVLEAMPAPVRVLFRVFWAPAYQRRARRLYGAAVA
jgi:hemerythrin-like domain-containing protein